MTTTNGLKFGVGNSKLVNGEATFSLPSGFTCPGAKDCLSKANKDTGKIQDGKDCKFRCFEASMEGVYKTVRNAVWHNLNLLKGKSVEDMVFLLQHALPKTFVVRIHVGGDFFSQRYFDAWTKVAELNPKTNFYAYTKSLPFVVSRFAKNGKVKTPSNFQIIASKGGRYDHMIKPFGFREAVVVYSRLEARVLKLEIDFDDLLAQDLNVKRFALLLHGTQPKGSIESKAWQKIKMEKKAAKDKAKLSLDSSK